MNGWHRAVKKMLAFDTHNNSRPSIEFTSCGAIHSADYVVARCPSIRPSVRYSAKTAKHIDEIFYHLVAQ